MIKMMGANENDEIGNDDDDMCDSLIAVSFQYKVISCLFYNIKHKLGQAMVL